MPYHLQTTGRHAAFPRSLQGKDLCSISSELVVLLPIIWLRFPLSNPLSNPRLRLFVYIHYVHVYTQYTCMWVENVFVLTRRRLWLWWASSAHQGFPAACKQGSWFSVPCLLACCSILHCKGHCFLKQEGRNRKAQQHGIAWLAEWWRQAVLVRGSAPAVLCVQCVP